MRPFSRRGLGFGFSGPAGLDGRTLYDPPVDLTHSMDLDQRLFSAYFLVAEPLATFVGYRIAQHCLRGCRVSFLSPSQRMWIGICYCWLKIQLIAYAFHGTAYYILSLVIIIVYFVYAFLAFGFHSGPLQFLFFDNISRTKMTQSLIYKMARVCQNVSSRVECYILQQLLCCLPLEMRDCNAMTASSIPATHPLEPFNPMPRNSNRAMGFSRVTSFFGRQLNVSIELWNHSMCQQWILPLSSKARATASRVKTSCANENVRDDAVFECRYMFVMQHDGLLLGFFLTAPSATLMVKFKHGKAMPFELLLRFHCETRSVLANVPPVVLYAESPKLVGRANVAQKNAVFRLLLHLNKAHGNSVDVSLRALRAKNFVDAGVGQVMKKKTRVTGSFSELSG